MCHCSAAAFDKYTFYANRHLSEQLSSQLSELNCSTVAKLAAAAEENRPAVFNSTLFCNHFFSPGLDIRHQQQQQQQKRHRRLQGGANSRTVQYTISVDSYPSVSQFYFRKAHLHLLILFQLVPLSQINMEQRQQQSLKNRETES